MKFCCKFFNEVLSASVSVCVTYITTSVIISNNFVFNSSHRKLKDLFFLLFPLLHHLLILFLQGRCSLFYFSIFFFLIFVTLFNYFIFFLLFVILLHSISIRHFYNHTTFTYYILSLLLALNKCRQTDRPFPIFPGFFFNPQTFIIFFFLVSSSFTFFFILIFSNF